MISAAPIITEAPASIGVDILTNATLQCIAIGKPKPEVKWAKGENADPVKAGGRFHILENGALFIQGKMLY